MAVDSEEQRRAQNAMFRLGNLLQKTRDENRARLVDQVVTSNLSTEEKILKIIDIDSRPDQELPARNKTKIVSATIPRAEDSRNTTEEEPKAPESLKAAPARNRSRYRKTVARGSILSFIVSEYWKIRAFALTTGTIRVSFVPFIMNFAVEKQTWYVKDVLETRFQVLLRTMELILDRAWKFCTKSEYNYLAVLREMLQVAKAYQDKKSVKSVAGNDFSPNPAEADFWLFYSNRPLIVILKQNIDTLGRRSNLPVETIKLCLSIVDEIFDARQDRCTLATYYRARAMLATLRYIGVSDLSDTVKQTQDYISESRFECSQIIQNDIDTWVTQLRQKTGDLAKRLRILNRLHVYLPGINKPDEQLLLTFYRSANLEETDNPALWTLRFHEVFIRAVSPWLEYPLINEAGQAQLLVPRGVMQAVLGRMRLMAARLGTALTAKPDFSLIRWRLLLSNPASAEGPEIDLVSSLAEFSSLYLSLGRGLSDIIQSRSLLAPETLRDAGNLSDTNPIPREGDVLPNQGVFDGLSLIDTLILTIKLSYLTAIKLGDKSILIEWEQYTLVRSELAETVRQIIMTGSPEDLNDTLALYQVESGLSVDILNLT